QLLEGAVGRGLFLEELESLILRRHAGHLVARAAPATERPQGEGQRGHGDGGDRHHLGRHHRSERSRRMRSRLAPSSAGGVGAAARGARLQRRTSAATRTRPAASPAKGSTQTRSVKPWRGGERRIHAPYLSTKYAFTCSGVSPWASRSRMMPRIWCAV